MCVGWQEVTNALMLRSTYIGGGVASDYISFSCSASVTLGSYAYCNFSLSALTDALVTIAFGDGYSSTTLIGICTVM